MGLFSWVEDATGIDVDPFDGDGVGVGGYEVGVTNITLGGERVGYDQLVTDPNVISGIATGAIAGFMVGGVPGAVVGGAIGGAGGAEASRHQRNAERDQEKAENAQDRIRSLNTQIRINEQIRAAQREASNLTVGLGQMGLIDANSSVGRQASAESARLTATNVRNISLGADFTAQYEDAVAAAARDMQRQQTTLAALNTIGTAAQLYGLYNRAPTPPTNTGGAGMNAASPFAAYEGLGTVGSLPPTPGYR